MQNIIKEVLNLINIDSSILKKGKERQSKIWKNEKVDFLPIILGNLDAPDRNKYPKFNRKEQYFNPEHMLYEQLWEKVILARGESDAQLSVRVNTGTGTLATIFGLQQQVLENNMPWLTEHLSKEKISKMEISDFKYLEKLGEMPRILEYLKFYKEKLNNKINIFLSDTQAPFDIAHLVRGNDIFTDFYDDPYFVHHLMELSTYVYINSSKIMKEAIGESVNSGFHDMLYMEGCGFRACLDTDTLLPSALFEEFVIPYLVKITKELGNLWVHFCGDGNHILNMILEIEGIKGVNFGNSEKFNPKETMRKIIKKNKIYYGNWNIEKDEKIEDYLNRVLSFLNGKKGNLIFTASFPKEVSRKRIIDTWRSLQ